MQKQDDETLRPVAYASKSLTETERRYAQIEKEALAITWAMEHWQNLLIGLRDLKVETDHRPLVPLLSTKSLDELPIRVQRFRIRLMKFNFKISHVPGKLLYTADALSRSPLPTFEDIDNLRESTELCVQTLMTHIPSSHKRLEEIRQELKKDDTLSAVMNYVLTGWPKNWETLSGPIRKYWDERGTLSVHDEVLLKGNRLVIPGPLRQDVLRRLHDAHQGIQKIRLNASQSCWWPGISKDIEYIVKSCNRCEEHRRDRIEPMLGTEFPERPWSRVGADFFQLENSLYLLAVDYYSRDIEICLVTRTVDTIETITKFKKIFSRHGVCDVLVTDNAPVFSSKEFAQFCKSWKFDHITSSPHYPQSNGEAERAVQTVKNLLKKSDDKYLALMNYRNTPLHNGYSPAQLSMGRRFKTLVPCHPDELLPSTVDSTVLQRKEKDYRAKMAQNYNKRHRVVTNDNFAVGDRVYIPDCSKKGVIEKIDDKPRSILIKTDNGVMRRNRRMVRKYKSPESVKDSSLNYRQSYGHFKTRDSCNNVAHSALRNSTAIQPQHRDIRRSTRIRKATRRYIEEA